MVLGDLLDRLAGHVLEVGNDRLDQVVLKVHDLFVSRVV